MLGRNEESAWQRASASLDATAKIYGYRVDSVHTETFKFLGGLNRNKKDMNSKDDNDEEGAIDGDNISFDNSANKTIYRAFKSLNTKHISATAVITINNPTEVSGDTSTETTKWAKKSNAVVGYVFGLEEVDKPTSITAEKVYKYKADGTLEGRKMSDVKWYNFGIAGIRYNNVAEKSEWYVSYCTNVPNVIFGYNMEADFEAKLITDVNTDGSVKTTIASGAEENQLLPTSGVFQTVGDLTLTDNKLACQVKVTIPEDGSYTVELLDANGATISSQTCSVPVNGLTKTTQKDIGRYTSVYAGEKITATMSFTDISGNPIPVSEDDWVDLEG